MKKFIAFAVLFTFIFNIVRPAFCNSNTPDLPGVQGAPFGSYLNDQPPIIYKVEQIPEKPKENEKVKIIATVANDEEKTDDITVSVKLHYSTDNGLTYQEIEMIQDNKDKKIWKAEIPEQPAGTKVIYYISAKDTSGNITSESPEVLMTDLLKDVFLPVKNFDMDDKDELVKKEKDILETYAGYDNERLYVRMKVEGKIKEEDDIINNYIVFILNPDMGEDILGGFSLKYSPGNKKLCNKEEIGLYKFTEEKENKQSRAKEKSKFAKLKIKGWNVKWGINPEMALKKDTKNLLIIGGVVLVIYGIYWIGESFAKAMGKMFEEIGQVFTNLFLGLGTLLPNIDVKYSVDEDTLTITSPRNVFRKNPSNTLKLLFVTSSCSTCCEKVKSSQEIFIGDASTYLLLYLRSHSYTVENY